MNDLYKEHELHNEYEQSCSTCWSEVLMVKQSIDKIYRAKRTREEIGSSRNHFTDNQISPNPIRD